MFKKVFIIYFLILGFNSKAQIWTPLDTGIHNYIPYGLVADNVKGNLFAFGNTSSTVLSVWRNNQWEVWYKNRHWGTYGSEVAMLNNKVLFFYPYYENNDPLKKRTAILQFSDSTDLDTLKILLNQDWISSGTSSSCIYQGQLILYSTIYNITGVNCIATFDGNTITPIGHPSVSRFYTACVYNGDLYAAATSTIGQRGVFKKTLSGWQLIYEIQGSTAFINGMIVYNNRMFIYGEISTLESPSNLGNNIIAYDGFNFDTLGGGVINEFNITDGKIYDVAINNDRLYVTGNFNKAGGVKAMGVAYWNDTTWCGIHKDMDTTNNFFRIESFNDTIYEVANFIKVKGDTTFGWIAKLYNKNYSDTCSESFFVSVKELPQVSNFKIYPNPTTSIINIVDENNQLQNASIEIKNYLGQLVYTSTFTSQINLSSLSTGMYFLTIEDKHSKKTVKIIKQ
jgi:hypothetical protein